MRRSPATCRATDRRCPSLRARDAAPLAQLVHEKTAGNPFFVIQFLHALAEEGLLRFDHDAARWSWDLDRIRAKGYTDNVVDLMVGKLTRLPVETQQALQQLACLGNVADIAMLSIVLAMSEEQSPRGAVAGGPPGLGRAAGWRLQVHPRPSAGSRLFADPGGDSAPRPICGSAGLLVAQTPPENREEAIFEIVDQLNRGAALITSARGTGATRGAQPHRRQARENLIGLCLGAAISRRRRARCWREHLGAEQSTDLAFDLELNRAECEFLTGELTVSGSTADDVVELAPQITVERCDRRVRARRPVYDLDQSDSAVAVGLDYLRRVDRRLVAASDGEDVRRDYDRLWRGLAAARSRARLICRR